MSDFGQCFQALLRDKKITQIQAAARCGFYQSRISRLCNQPHPPQDAVVKHIAESLDVSEDELLGGAGGGVLREKGTAYRASISDPWIAWGKQLAAAYKRDPDVVASAVRAAWPRATAENILAWLKDR